MLFLTCPSEQELRSSANHVEPMADELVEDLLEIEQAWFAIDQRQENIRERILQR